MLVKCTTCKYYSKTLCNKLPNNTLYDAQQQINRLFGQLIRCSNYKRG